MIMGVIAHNTTESHSPSHFKLFKHVIICSDIISKMNLCEY